jgi:phosphoglycerol geranylgeranyltransferase
VRRFYDGILIVGGGITSADKAEKVATAGANIIVIGNLLQAPKHEVTLRKVTNAVRRA